MAPTFDEFKGYFEFGIEVIGVGGAIGTAVYKFDAINVFFRVARGRANSADHTLAVEALQGAGGVGEQVIRYVAERAQGQGHQNAATRLNEIRSEVQARSRAASPGEMV